MVQGVKTKTRKSPTVQLDYVINIIDIKPWPPSQSLRSLRSVLLQWEHGGKSSGSTKAVAPLLVSASGVGDGKIEFNESFKLRVTLLRDMSIKASDSDTFLKNCIELNMYEPRRDKTVKGQLLATAVVDFAEYGIVKDGLEVSVPVNCKRIFSNTIQPMLFLKIEAVDKSNRVRSDSMNEENIEDTESASVTDDDVISQSSMAAMSLTSRSNGSLNPQEEFLVQDKTVVVPVAEAKDDIGYQVNDAGDQQSYMPVSNTYESLNEQESRILKATESNILTGDRFRKVKSAHSPLESGYTNGSLRSSKVQQLEQKVQSLEGELREAAAIEVGLYSIVAEHGSSVNKVHAPARRLSRLYLHSCKEKSQSRRASSARSIVSGLILVAKACGNDVPRLTFWMSNCVVLRAIIYNSFEQEHLALSSGRLSKKNNDINSSFKWKKGSSIKESRNGIPHEWQNPCTLTSALEQVESWIFSRIIESVWWQTLTPYMQSAAAKAIIRVVDSGSSKASKKTLRQRDQEQANFSTELWTTAFMDACERICPVRAEGHDCGCLPVLSRLVMEQCMTRLDVAMFNAILRESADDVPTDPVSDPISDARVLPISSGKASFGAGAQLKNAIGNWSRWLTDLFGIDDDPLEDENDDRKTDASFKSFHLLNALSDLMMLPKDMLLDSTIRKEVCPAFGGPVIRRMLDTFVPDEFCPDRIPEAVFKALDSEDSFEGGEDCVTSLPCAAASVVYHPPSASSIGFIFGDSASRNQLTRSGSILNKSNTSDDELDELSSPLTSIIGTPRGSPAPTKPNWRSKDTGSHSSIRYKLLKEGNISLLSHTHLHCNKEPLQLRATIPIVAYESLKEASQLSFTRFEIGGSTCVNFHVRCHWLSA